MKSCDASFTTACMLRAVTHTSAMGRKKDGWWFVYVSTRQLRLWFISYNMSKDFVFLGWNYTCFSERITWMKILKWKIKQRWRYTYNSVNSLRIKAGTCITSTMLSRFSFFIFKKMFVQVCFPMKRSCLLLTKWMSIYRKKQIEEIEWEWETVNVTDGWADRQNDGQRRETITASERKHELEGT